jgi:hypothetical protein
MFSMRKGAIFDTNGGAVPKNFISACRPAWHRRSCPSADSADSIQVNLFKMTGIKFRIALICGRDLAAA